MSGWVERRGALCGPVFGPGIAVVKLSEGDQVIRGKPARSPQRRRGTETSGQRMILVVVNL